MDRRKLLLMGAVVAGLVALNAGPAVADDSAEPSPAPTISAASDSGSVWIAGSASNTVDESKTSTDEPSDQVSETGTTTAPASNHEPDDRPTDPLTDGNDCVYSQPVDPAQDVCGPTTDTDETEETVTIDDVARFAPKEGTAHLEPEGWALVGLPMNAYGESAPYVAAGTLFEQPVEVRFTAASWHWDFGDGTAVDATTAGGTWTALGQDEFTTTASSHTYADRGPVHVTADIVYDAAYRFAGTEAWTPIAGTLTVRSGEWDVLVGTASTVLTNGSCAQNPSGPGC
jgi:hypothetical protein